jgi:hypothetical protein
MTDPFGAFGTPEPPAMPEPQPRQRSTARRIVNWASAVVLVLGGLFFGWAALTTDLPEPPPTIVANPGATNQDAVLVDGFTFARTEQFRPVFACSANVAELQKPAEERDINRIKPCLNLVIGATLHNGALSEVRYTYFDEHGKVVTASKLAGYDVTVDKTITQGGEKYSHLRFTYNDAFFAAAVSAGGEWAYASDAETYAASHGGYRDGPTYRIAVAIFDPVNPAANKPGLPVPFAWGRVLDDFVSLQPPTFN